MLCLCYPDVLLISLYALFKVYIREFDSPCDHGFYNRGDLEDPLVLECVETAFTHMLMLFETYL